MPGWVGGVLVALCAGTVWGLMQYFTPVMVDDLVFVAQYLAANDGDGSFSLDALRRFALYNRLHDNFRIANMLAPFSTVISPWKELFPVFTGLAGAAMLWLSARLARGGGSRLALRLPRMARGGFFRALQAWHVCPRFLA